MIQVNGTIKVADIDEATMAALHTMISASRAEDGCLDYSYARCLVDPDTLVIYERWRDQDALTAHFQSQHMADFRAAIGASGVITARDIRRYETDEGQPL